MATAVWMLCSVFELEYVLFVNLESYFILDNETHVLYENMYFSKQNAILLVVLML